MRWNIHLWILMRCLTEGKRCAWADRSTGRNCTVSWWHHAMDHGLLMMLLLLAVETAALQVWTQGTEVVPVLRVVMVRWHVLITHASERRRLQTEVAKEGQGPADRGWC
jgi:hypothetical protein